MKPANNESTPEHLDESLSFACGGWLYLYMFGVARALQAYGLEKKYKLLGCSAGALVAAGLSFGSDFDKGIEYVKDECIPITYGSPMYSGLFRLGEMISKCLDVYCNLHRWKELTNGKLQVAITQLPLIQGELTTEYSSREDLKASLMASSAIFPLAPLVYRRGGWCIDGGITNFQPTLNANTIRVSPFYFSDADIKPSRYVPINWALIPPKSSETIDWLYRLGWDDTIQWIHNQHAADIAKSNSSSSMPQRQFDMYPSDPPTPTHAYDNRRCVSAHRLMGYNVRDCTHSYVAYLLDFSLILGLIFIWKPLVLLLIYVELCLWLVKNFLVTVVHECYDLFPMISLSTAFLGFEHYHTTLYITTPILTVIKMILIGPSPAHKLSDLWECISCMGSLSLLSRFISLKLSKKELRKHQKLLRMSFVYRFVRHSL